MRGIVVALVWVVACAARADEPRIVWWEGESATEHNFPAKTSMSPHTLADTRGLLSGGDWLTSEGKLTAAPRFARYRVEVPEAGAYALWVRKFWKHGPFRWRFDDGPWRSCGRDVALLDSVTLRTHLSANWVHLGEATLPAGVRTFEIELAAGPGEESVAGFECFVLARGMFIPRGHRRHGESLTHAEPGFFAFDPTLDPFTDQALLDLRHLNEPVAGEHGFVRREGDRLVLGDGTPVRFWSVNLGPAVFEQPDIVLDYLARRLAKIGVNMVRLHGPIFDEAGPERVNPRRLDAMQRAVAAMKRQGIYTTLSFYFPVWMSVTPSTGLDGFDAIDNKKPFGLIFFSDRMQAMHRDWTTALLTAENPHGGEPLARDPAVAIVELVNEDSLFFWTLSKKNIPPLQWTVLEQRFGAWLAKRHGTIDAAFKAWGERPGRGDDVRGGRVEVFEAWHMTRNGLKNTKAPRQKRIADQVRFFTELQCGYYAEATRHIRQDLGYAGLVTASNWHTADVMLLDPLERYSYTAGDILDFHGYFDRGHEGEAASYSVRDGHIFADSSALRVPDRAPVRVDQVAGFPSMISEVNWTNPSPWRAEATAILSAYGALQGLDAIHLFAVNDPTLLNQGLEKFSVSDAAVAGTFPATALLYRRGDVAEAATVVHQALQLSDLYALKGQAPTGDAALEAFRAADVPAQAATASVETVDRLAFFVGKVTRSFDQAGDRPVMNIDPSLLQRDAKIVRSATRELMWDWGREYVTVQTPRCVGAAGFLKAAGPLHLGGIEVHCNNPYASVFVIALDDKPLAESSRVLVQAMTREQYFGFRTEPAKNAEGEMRRRIVSRGRSPLNIENIDVTIRIGGSWRATPLDGHGYAAGDAQPFEDRIKLREDVLYTVLTR